VATPQKEDGYTAIANEIMDALCRIRIPGEERQILDVILRKTYGYNKCEDWIALSQFSEATGINKPCVIRAIKGLLSKKIIIVIEKDNGAGKVFKLNKNHEEWIPLSKKITLSKKIIVVIEKDNPSLSKKIPTKDNTTKDNITKDRGPRTLRKPPLTDSEWLSGLKENPAYKYLSVDILYQKMLVWCETNGKKPTRRRFVNWLNREERPLHAQPEQRRQYVTI